MCNSRTNNFRKLFDHSICSQKRQQKPSKNDVKMPAKIGENLFSAAELPKIQIFEILFKILKLYAIFSYLTNFHKPMAIFKEFFCFCIFSFCIGSN